MPASQWQRELADAIRDPLELLRLLELDRPELREHALEAARLFPLRVTRSFIARMRKGDPADPLLLQVLPLAAELEHVPGFGSDPVGDLASQRTPGLLQKYHGRALLITTGACAIHCRYCFRRAYPYESAGFRPGQREAIRDALLADPGLEEVILSGGDPLTLANDKLHQLLELLAEIPHLRRVRIHSRLPVVLPSRVDTGLIDTFKRSRFRFVHVIHVNHANEIDPSVAAAVATLRDTGALVLNQAVLLKGINDSAAILAGLSQKLIEIGIMPYYLHLLDRVQGAHHFETDQEKAVQLIKTLQQQLPGYMVPKLVREEQGAPGKTVISAD
ncbi:MAG TPA: EF-P beta-lysylation protein EpmB [Gammaproteobacteria bacterium]|nr:EF-P beta-lysylation protein EpmB [Gammaproteobacteria bacterium]